MRPLIAFLLLSSSVQATPLPDGFDLSVLTPVLPGISTTSNVAARNPFDGSLWMSNGQAIYHLDGSGGIISSESLLSGSGGPLGVNGVSTDLVFDAAGAVYVNRFDTGVIYKRPIAGSWAPLATVDRPRAMEFDALGNLITIGGNNDPTLPGTASSISPLGVVTPFGVTQGESFVVLANGDMIVPKYDGTGLDRLTMAGVLTTEFSWARPIPILYEAVGLTAGGNYIVGVNLGYDEDSGFNRSQIIRINGVTGLREVIGDDVVLGQIPVDMIIPGDLIISNFGSLQGFALSGNLDGPLSFAGGVPEPSTLALAGLGLIAFALRRRYASR